MFGVTCDVAVVVVVDGWLVGTVAGVVVAVAVGAVLLLLVSLVVVVVVETGVLMSLEPLEGGCEAVVVVAPGVAFD